MVQKKNQHYVPQFYLKNFSIENNRRSIGLFNLSNELFVQSTSIKNQSSENFYYGKDGQIEEGLSKLESLLAPKITEIISSKELPKKESEEHIALLIHVILTDLRNPTNINQTKDSISALKREMLKFSPKAIDNELLGEISHELAVELSFSSYQKVLPLCFDLDYKLLICDSNSSLLTSDFPVVKYNQFLENKNFNGSNQGYASLGLQIFIPLNPQMCVIFYDPTVYKVGTKRSKVVELDSKDVDQINLLHFINCKTHLYFNENISEVYVRKLLALSKKYEKANQTRASSYGVIKDGEVKENEQIVFLSSTDVVIGLKLSHLKSTRRASSIDLENKNAPMRPKAELVFNKYYRQKRV